MTSKLKTLASVIKVILRTNFSMFFSFTFTLVKEKRYAMTLMNSVVAIRDESEIQEICRRL
jgi:fibronectin type 3 domain-containing protein